MVGSFYDSNIILLFSFYDFRILSLFEPSEISLIRIRINILHLFSRIMTCRILPDITGYPTFSCRIPDIRPDNPALSDIRSNPTLYHNFLQTTIILTYCQDIHNVYSSYVFGYISLSCLMYVRISILLFLDYAKIVGFHSYV